MYWVQGLGFRGLGCWALGARCGLRRRVRGAGCGGGPPPPAMTTCTSALARAPSRRKMQLTRFPRPLAVTDEFHHASDLNGAPREQGHPGVRCVPVHVRCVCTGAREVCTGARELCTGAREV